MKKHIRTVALILGLLIGFFLQPGRVCAKSMPAEEKEVTIWCDGMTGDTITVRYYRDKPNVPYVGISEYYDMFIRHSADKTLSAMKVERQEGGTYLLTDSNGTAVVDIINDTMTSDDMTAFTNIMSITQEGMENAYCDGRDFVRVKEIKTEGSGKVVFDFGAYGIDLRAGKDEIWFPHATLSNIFSDLACHHTEMDGGIMYLLLDGENMTVMYAEPDSAFASLRSRFEDDTRPADLIKQTYSDLCFSLEYLYGYSGRTIIEEEMKKQGLDAALKAYGESGKKTVELLNSESQIDFLLGMEMLTYFLEDGDHTIIHMGSAGLEPYMPEDYRTAFFKRVDELGPIFDELQEYVTKNDLETDFDTFDVLAKLSDKAYGEGTYHTEGHTAVYELDSFYDYDPEIWDSYYEKGTKLPTAESALTQDAVLGLKAALEKADSDPKIRNLVIDVSKNLGGSLDILTMIISLATGRNEVAFTAGNALTGQKITEVYEADRNFDGAFDNKDSGSKPDLNIAVLTSNVTYSCGNIFSSYMKDEGYMTIGEKSAGGACAAQMLTLDEGYSFQVSSWRMRFTDKKGEIIDSGVPVDVNLMQSSGKADAAGADYSGFYDIDAMQKEMDVFYKMTPDTGDYTVSPGDCLWTISEKRYGTGMNYDKIADSNKIDSPFMIFINQILHLPFM